MQYHFIIYLNKLPPPKENAIVNLLSVHSVIQLNDKMSSINKCKMVCYTTF